VKLVVLATLLLAGCGGGSDVSWCFSGGAVSAGFNTAQCPPQTDQKAAQPLQ
jgi:hypothetical protein